MCKFWQIIISKQMTYELKPANTWRKNIFHK